MINVTKALDYHHSFMQRMTGSKHLNKQVLDLAPAQLYIQFYGDNDQHRNKFFSFKCSTMARVREASIYFHARMKIRSMYLVIRRNGNVILNRRMV